MPTTAIVRTAARISRSSSSLSIGTAPRHLAGVPILYRAVLRLCPPKWLRRGLLAALLLARPPLAQGAPDLVDPAARALETRLDNGLVVLTLEDHATPVVSFQMWVVVGSRDETRYTGIAHLFEHMMFKGSKNVAPEEHARLIEARGGRVNAYTQRDFTVYHEDVSRESLP